jgi:hexosaminidase
LAALKLIGEPAAIEIIPNPAQVAVGEGSFELTSQTVVMADPGATSEADTLVAALRVPTGFAFPRGQDGQKNFIRLRLEPELKTRLGPEGYSLSVRPEGVTIRAAAPAGLFYGGITLRQLLPATVLAQQQSKGPWTVPCLEIEDRPQFAWRGLLIDVARHYMPVEFLKKTVDVLALQKMNQLQLHLTDDQGWRIQIRKYPRLAEVGSIRKESPRHGHADQGDGTPYGPYFYTQEQIRDLVAYAAARHVVIVPEIEMPGHFLAALAAYPEFSCRGGPFQVRTRWGVEPDILCPGNEASFTFVQDILGEVMEMFPSEFIHIGGDEAPRDRWKECPKCQARMRAEGLSKEAQLQTYFNRRVEEFLTRGGRRLIGWDEILEGGLTPGAAVMSWRGMEGGVAAAKAGHDVVMSPTTHCYFDYAQSKDPGEPESIGGYIPLEKVYAFDPLPRDLAPDKRHHILGGQGNVWTEFLTGPSDVEYFAFPRAVALAEVLWSPANAKDYEDFCRRLPACEKRLDVLKVRYRR